MSRERFQALAYRQLMVLLPPHAKGRSGATFVQLEPFLRGSWMNLVRPSCAFRVLPAVIRVSQESMSASYAIQEALLQLQARGLWVAA